jgi:hypothetical protein
MKNTVRVMVFFAIATHSVAQVTNLIPPSPNAAAMTKYGEVPVSLYTGTPTISIPLLEIKVGEVSVPIGVNYHASGLKVEEIASNVGAGWSLSAGGAITRTIRGLADEDESFGYFNQTTDLASMLDINTPMADKVTFFNKVQVGENDAEPDVYYLNLGGLSGKFLVDKTTKEGYNLHAGTVKIKWLVATDQWVVTDNNGVRYYLGKAYKGDQTLAVERSQYRSSTYANVNGQSSQNRDGIKFFNYPNAWMLKQILLPNGEQIDFSYSSYQTEYCTIANEMTSYSLGTPDSQCGILSANQKTSQKTTTFGKKISAIQFNNGSVQFEYSADARLDVTTTDNALKKIILKDASNNIIKSFRFEQSYFPLDSRAAFTVACAQPAESKLKLNQVQEYAGDGNCLPPYVFLYEAGNLPRHTAMTQDHWGFHNGQSNLTLIPEYATPILEGRIFNLQGAKRFSDFNAGKIGTLNKIKYPTGGETLFEYESHEVWSPDFTFEAQLASTNNESVSVASTDLQPGDIIAEKPLSISASFIYNGVTGQWVTINTYTGTSNCDWSIRGQGGCGVEFTLIGTGVSYSLSGFSNQDIFLPSGNYTLRLRVRDPEYAPDDLQCEIIKLTTTNSSNYTAHNKKVGGLRIKKIINKESGNVVSVTKYKYMLPGTQQSSGVLYQVPQYAYVGTGMVREIMSTLSSTFIYSDICSELVRFSSSQISLVHGQGSHVEYSYVEEIKTETEAAENGLKTAYTYSTSQDYPDVNARVFPFPPPTSYEWKRGDLLSQIEYRFENNTYTPMKETTFTYTVGDNRYSKSVLGLRLGCMGYSITSLGGAGCADARFGEFSVASGWTYLKSKSEKIFDQVSPTLYTLSKDFFTYNNPTYLKLSTHSWIDSKSNRPLS